MQYINKIEIRGRVGRVSTEQYGDKMCLKASVATNYFYHDKDGEPVVETQWLNLTYWSKETESARFRSVEKGNILHAWGRLRNLRYIASDGTERFQNEVLCNKVELEEE